ncbi:MAG: hypothetical protein WCW44_01355 [archaeon]
MKFKKSFTQKGFIGPIGDDLPSLVPIVTALLLFFTIFTITLNTYNTKNLEITKQVEMTSVARELKGDSLILDVNQFDTKCRSTKLKKYPYNFMTAIYPSEKDISKAVVDFANIASSADFGENILKDSLLGTDEYYFCSYGKIGSKAFTGKEKSYLVRYYPVAVAVRSGDSKFPQYIIIPSILAMVVWE